MIATKSINLIWELLIHFVYVFGWGHWNKYTGSSPVSVTLENPMIHGSAIHTAYRILAAFFIDMGAKTSIVENLDLLNQFSYVFFFYFK